ncbi:LeuA family protein [Natronorarus salvus]|uniref:LeuA family protein n=1 Tax=Natronorarus salvus TaxID=3117733 RepID=UPI002F26C438
MKLSDVTLREADQMPGRSYTADQKITAANHLDRLGLTFIQAGFPATGEKDQHVIRTLASSLDASVIGLARAVPNDVEAALDAEADIIEIFAPLSNLQLDHLIKKSREEMMTAMSEAVGQALAANVGVHVSLLDAFRTDSDVLVNAFEQFPDVEYITLADTVGAMTPPSVETALSELSNSVDLSRVGVHFHDDLGVATANTMTAHRLGVGKADVSVASLGERAGNPALEEVVAIGVLGDEGNYGLDEKQLVPVCTDVLEVLGEPIDPRKPILGTEVYEHESGIHTAAMLEKPALFEPFPPDRLGAERRLLFGDGTGRSGAKQLLKRAGIEPTERRIDDLLQRLSERGPLETFEAVSVAAELN